MLTDNIISKLKLGHKILNTALFSIFCFLIIPVGISYFSEKKQVRKAANKATEAQKRIEATAMAERIEQESKEKAKQRKLNWDNWNEEASQKPQGGRGTYMAINFLGTHKTYTNHTKYTATVLKNDETLALREIINNSEANAVFANAKDVYVAGYEETDIDRPSHRIKKATVWKNGVPFSLTDGNTNARAESVFVHGKDIYVAGGEFNQSGFTVATLWKNGEPTTLTDENGRGSRAVSVYVSGSDVYVAGYCTGTVAKHGKDPEIHTIPTVWKNGEVFYSHPGDPSESYPIYVVNGDVYVAGREHAGAIHSAIILYKNGEPIQRYTNGYNQAKAKSIFISGTDVYIAGSEAYSGNMRIPTLWKNGQVLYRLPFGTNNSEATSLFVSDGNTYMTGEGYDRKTGSIYIVWKNGVAIWGPHRAEARSVFAMSQTRVH